MLSKFLLGIEPMSKWDEFVNELYELGVEEYISLHENAFDEITPGRFIKHGDLVHRFFKKAHL
jgi:hypothetical protein